MVVPNIKIYDEKDKILRKVSNEVTFPMAQRDIDLINDAIKYLVASQDEDIAEEYNLRAGMGLAFIQLGVPKRIFVIANKDLDTGEVEKHIIINPNIIAKSEELV